MIDWEYLELTECIKNTYNKFYEASKNKRYAISRLADDYSNMGYIEDIIVDVTISEIMILEHEFILGYLEFINKRLKNFDLEDLKKELIEKEEKDLVNRMNKVIDFFNEILLEY